eukprot:Selendium_serpulae@DN4193_c0_g1_i5.p3
MSYNNQILEMQTQIEKERQAVAEKEEWSERVITEAKDRINQAEIRYRRAHEAALTSRKDRKTVERQPGNVRTQDAEKQQQKDKRVSFDLDLIYREQQENARGDSREDAETCNTPRAGKGSKPRRAKAKANQRKVPVSVDHANDFYDVIEL